MSAALQVQPAGASALPDDLKGLEAVIADGLQSFVEVGRALAAIRDARLYEVEGFQTFESYCRAKWDMGRNYANKLIASSAVAENVGYNCTQAPQLNEGQCRELAKLKDPEEQAQAWTAAVDSAPEGGVTAKHVAAVVAQYLGEPVAPARREPKQPDPPAAATAPEVVTPAAAPATPLPGSAFDVLEALRAQRQADPEFSTWCETRRNMAKSMPSKEARMLVFILDGGEIALARLGLNWSVTPETLKKAYKTACQTEHPDRGGTADRFRTVNHAHGLIKEYLTP